MPSQARAASQGSTSRNSPVSTPARRTDSTLALVLAPPQAELLGPGTGQSGELVQEDPHVIGVSVDHVEQLVTQHGELLGGRPAGIGDAVGAEHDLVHHPVVDGGEQLLLGADVVVERAFAQVVGRAELHDPRGVVPLRARRRVPRCR